MILSELVTRHPKKKEKNGEKRWKMKGKMAKNREKIGKKSEKNGEKKNEKNRKEVLRGGILVTSLGAGGVGVLDERQKRA